ncbi:MAG: hypothetical protein R3D00_17120 [Bacteroidia bacterium]
MPEVSGPMKMILELAQTGKISTYSYTESGVQGDPEKSKIDIRVSPDSVLYHHREIFSEYNNGRGGEEYSVIEFILNVNDSINRQKYEEYELVAEKDSVYITSVSPFEIMLTQTLMVDYSEKRIPLYRLDGYAHPGDAEPSHYKFWSPRFGIVMIWYGDETIFELIASPREEDQPLIVAMKQAALETI